jgi:hypothetical protein
MKQNLLILAGLGLCLISTAQYAKQESPATIVFESGFEEGDKSIWDDYDGNPDSENQIIADQGPFGTAGNHVIRLAVPTGQAGGSDLVKILPNQYDSLYVRWYLKYEPGFNFNARNHGGGLFAGSRDYLGQSDNRPNGDDFAISTLEYDWINHTPQLYVYYRGMYQDCANPAGSCWGDHFPCTSDEGQVYCTNPDDRDPPTPPVLTAGTWYCFEMKIKLGKTSSNGTGSDGELAFWVNGISCGAWHNLWMRTTEQLKLSILWLSLYHHDGTHSTSGVLIDNVTVSTGQIECSDISGVETSRITEKDIMIFPNPVDNMVTIRFSKYGKFSVLLHDISGNLLINKSFCGTETFLETSKLNHGIYCLTIKDVTDNSLVLPGRLICK